MLTIRNAIKEDAPAIQNLLEQLGYESELANLELSLSAQSADSEVFVALDGQRPVGFISLIYFDYFPLQESVCRITAITVDEKARGTGVGTKLIDFAANKALEKACVQLEVTTSLAREKTQRYYAYLGFEKASFRYVKSL